MAVQQQTRLSMKEAAQYFGHSYSWIWTNHRSIGLNGYRIGGRWFFDLQDLIEWETNQKTYSQKTRSANAVAIDKSKKILFA